MIIVQSCLRYTYPLVPPSLSETWARPFVPNHCPLVDRTLSSSPLFLTKIQMGAKVSEVEKKRGFRTRLPQKHSL